MPPSDTFFTASPGWTWLVVLYFFFGGIAGGSYFLSTMLGAFGAPEDCKVCQLGHFVALPAVLLCVPFLVFDLTRPERFWHMLVQSQTGWPMFKYWSPMSVGSWALLIFGGFAFVSFVGALIESGRLRWTPPGALTGGIFRTVFSIAGTLVGFFLASYTGVLLSVTNRPIWADSNLIGLVFLASAASTSAALLLLLNSRYALTTSPSVGWLKQVDQWVMLFELVIIAALVLSLGAVAQAWLNVWGVLLLVGVVLIGILIPLVLHWRPRLLGSFGLPAAAILALAGGFILRAVIVFSAQVI